MVNLLYNATLSWTQGFLTLTTYMIMQETLIRITFFLTWCVQCKCMYIPKYTVYYVLGWFCVSIYRLCNSCRSTERLWTVRHVHCTQLEIVHVLLFFNSPQWWSVCSTVQSWLVVITSESQKIFSMGTDGNRLCTCGGDGIVRVLDPSSKLEVISKRAPEVLQ